MVTKIKLIGKKGERWGPWKKGRYTIKLWEESESGGYNVYLKGKKLNKGSDFWLPSFRRALGFIRRYENKGSKK